MLLLGVAESAVSNANIVVHIIIIIIFSMSAMNNDNYQYSSMKGMLILARCSELLIKSHYSWSTQSRCHCRKDDVLPAYTTATINNNNTTFTLSIDLHQR